MYFTISRGSDAAKSVMQFYDANAEEVATVAVPAAPAALFEFYLQDDLQKQLWRPVEIETEHSKVLMHATAPGTFAPMFKRTR